MSAFKFAHGDRAPKHFTAAEIERFSYAAPDVSRDAEFVLYDPGPDDASVGEPVQFVERAAPAEEPAPRFTFWSWCWCIVRLIGFAAVAAALIAGLEVLAWLIGGA